MEIERKFLIHREHIPANLETYPHHQLEQAYLITEPVLRIRKKDTSYILTYKGQGFLKREEVEFPLPAQAYQKLLSKTEGTVITKTRYHIPEKENLTIEFDVFHGLFEGLLLAEVEFPSEEAALAYQPPAWFGKEVTHETTFHNSTLSQMSREAVSKLMLSLTEEL